MIDWKAIKKAADEDTYMNPDEDPNRPGIVDELLAKRFGQPGDEMDPGKMAPEPVSANPNIGYMRSALRSVYGRNNFDLSDDAYVQRKFNGMMNNGNKVYRQRLMAAYNEARQNGQGLTSRQGANVVPAYGYAGQGINRGGVAPAGNAQQQAYASQRATIDAINQRNHQVSQAYRTGATRLAQAGNINPNLMPTRGPDLDRQMRRTTAAAKANPAAYAARRKPTDPTAMK